MTSQVNIQDTSRTLVREALDSSAFGSEKNESQVESNPRLGGPHGGLHQGNRPSILTALSILDKLLTPLILLAMILGVVIGEFAPHVQAAFSGRDFNGVSIRE